MLADAFTHFCKKKRALKIYFKDIKVYIFLRAACRITSKEIIINYLGLILKSPHFIF